MPDDIRILDIDFDSNRYVDISQARELMVSCSQEFLDQINSDEQIRPYLHNYPFTANNIHLGMSFVEKNSSKFIKPPYIAYVTLIKGIIYYTCDYNPLGALTDLYEEPYEEAVKIINGEATDRSTNIGS